MFKLIKFSLLFFFCFVSVPIFAVFKPFGGLSVEKKIAMQQAQFENELFVGENSFYEELKALCCASSVVESGHSVDVFCCLLSQLQNSNGAVDPVTQFNNNYAWLRKLAHKFYLAVNGRFKRQKDTKALAEYYIDYQTDLAARDFPVGKKIGSIEVIEANRLMFLEQLVTLFFTMEFFKEIIHKQDAALA